MAAFGRSLLSASLCLVYATGQPEDFGFDDASLMQLRAQSASATESNTVSMSELKAAASTEGPWAGCKAAPGANWTPKTNLHLVHIPRTMGSTMEWCSEQIPKELNLSKWGNQEQMLGGAKRLNYGMVSKLKGKTVTVHFRDPNGNKEKAAPVAGLLTEVWTGPKRKNGDAGDPMIRLVSTDGSEKVTDLNRNSIKWVNLLETEEETKKRKEQKNAPWASKIMLERNCYSQHTPPAFLQAHQREMNAPFPYSDPMSNFCSVRHPYSRMVSQFNYAETYNMKLKNGSHFKCSVESLNAYLLDRLQDVREGDMGRDDCHFVPHSLYVYGYDVITGRADKSQKWCGHLMHFETAAKDFNLLMTEQGYGLQLEDLHKNPQHTADNVCESLRPTDIYPEVIKLIDEVYEEDFELFGYKMGDMTAGKHKAEA